MLCIILTSAYLKARKKILNNTLKWGLLNLQWQVRSLHQDLTQISYCYTTNKTKLLSLEAYIVEIVGWEG